MAEKKEIKVAFNRILTPGAGVAKAASRFFWTAVGNEVQLEMGYPDLLELHQAIERAKLGGVEETSVNVNISDRFLLSPTAARGLLKAMEAVVAHLKKNNLLPEEGDATN